MAQQTTQPETPGVKFKVKAGPETAPKEIEVNAAEGDLKPWDLDSKLRVVKGRQPRLDGPLKVTGKAKYTFDISVPGMLWGHMVGAAVPAAEITKIDTSKAEKLPGVKAVWTTDSRTVRFAGPSSSTRRKRPASVPCALQAERVRDGATRPVGSPGF